MARQASTRSWVLVGAAATMVVASCTSGGTPAPPTTAAGATSPTVTSSTGTTSATQSVPTSRPSTDTSTSSSAIPSGAGIDSPYGAVEFVRFVVTEVNRAYRIPSAAILDPYISTTCPGCRDIHADIAEVEQLHQRATADTWAVTICYPNTWSPGTATVVVTIRQSRVDFVDRDGRKVDEMKPGDHQFLLTLSYVSGWRIDRWQKT